MYYLGCVCDSGFLIKLNIVFTHTKLLYTQSNHFNLRNNALVDFTSNV